MKTFGPYSPYSEYDNLVFTAGQVGVDPYTKQAASDIAEQTRQALLNLEAVLKSASSSLKNVKKTTVFLANMDDFEAMNSVYAEFFVSQGPARSTVAVKELPRVANVDLLVEIDAVAVKETQ